jgi:hypothetical protein
VWISVKDRLPGQGCKVLTFGIVAEQWGYYLEKNLVCENYITIAGWQSPVDDYEVTHWMPLPEPPKGV